MSERKWMIRSNPSEEFQLLFPDEHPVAQSLLFTRNIRDAKSATAFLSPHYDDHTHDPFLLKNMDRAVERLSSAIKNNERIVVYSDYDADGVCGGVVFHDFLKAVQCKNFENFIPHRYKEGYGLTEERIRSFHEQGAKVLITIDCGVTDYEEIELAQSLDVDVIVIDHHLVPPKWPPAYAIIDYKQEDDTYPSKYLSGAGLAFKTVQGVLSQGNWPVPLEWSKWLLDAVAIAAVADMVPLLGENRVLTAYGLKVLGKTRRSGLQELYKSVRLNPNEITSDTIGFTIAPRINAASRMGQASLAFRLLTTDSSEEARIIVRDLEAKNQARRDLVEKIVKEIRQAYPQQGISSVIYTGSKEWLPGVLGIVATRLVEEFGKPTFLWGGSGTGGASPSGVGNSTFPGTGETDTFYMEHMKGSCRTMPGINAVEVMRSCSEHLLDFGGHNVAGGFSLNEQAVPAFGEALETAVSKVATNLQPEELLLEAELAIHAIDWELYNTLAKFEPFGMENRKPLFLLSGLEVAYVQQFGPAKNHLKLGFWTPRNTILWAFKFGADPKWFRDLHPGLKLDLAAALESNEWQGNRELRLRIEDIRVTKG